MEIEISSPAKINLMLAITGRRDDGFHSLSSLVTPIDFCDTVQLKVDTNAEGIELESTDGSLPTGKANIAWRAADLFLRRFRLQASVAVRIEKRIPVGAGLGGGSSNAASVLKGLARLFGIDETKVLLELAAELGSDCPLFLESEPLIMRGRGEIIERLDDAVKRSLSGRSILLFKPSFGISTVWAYKSLAIKGAYENASQVESHLEEWKKGTRPLESLLANSFDSVVGRKYPSIPLLLKAIREKTGAPCLMSGSGSCCFALCESGQADSIRDTVAECWGSNAFLASSSVVDIELTGWDGLSF